MGGTHSRISQTAVVMSDSFFKALVSVKQDCQASASATNVANVTATGKLSADELAAIKPCLATGKSVAECMGQKGFVQQDVNLTQKASVNLKTTCSVDQSQQSDICNKMASELAQTASSKNDAAGETLKALSGGSTLDMKNTAMVSSVLKAQISTELMNKIVATAVAMNSKDIKAEAGLGAAVINQRYIGFDDANVTAFASAVMTSENIAKVVNDQETKLTQKASYSSSMIACIIFSIVVLLIVIIGAYIYMQSRKPKL